MPVPVGRAFLTVAALLLVATGQVVGQGRRNSVEIGAAVSRLRLTRETSTTLAVWTWGLALSASRYRGSRGFVGQVVLYPGGTFSGPPLIGLSVGASLRSSRGSVPTWRPVADGTVGVGLLAFGEYIVPLVAVCDDSQCRGYPGFEAGSVPFLSLAGGITLPLPLSLGLRADGAVDFPARAAAEGGSPHLRFGLGITIRRQSGLSGA